MSSSRPETNSRRALACDYLLLHSIQYSTSQLPFRPFASFRDNQRRKRLTWPDCSDLALYRPSQSSGLTGEYSSSVNGRISRDPLVKLKPRDSRFPSSLSFFRREPVINHEIIANLKPPGKLPSSLNLSITSTSVEPPSHVCCWPTAQPNTSIMFALDFALHQASRRVRTSGPVIIALVAPSARTGEIHGHGHGE